MNDLVNGPYPTGMSVDKRWPKTTEDGLERDDPSSVYGTANGGHVVVNDRTETESEDTTDDTEGDLKK